MYTYLPIQPILMKHPSSTYTTPPPFFSLSYHAMTNSNQGDADEKGYNKQKKKHVDVNNALLIPNLSKGSNKNKMLEKNKIFVRIFFSLLLHFSLFFSFRNVLISAETEQFIKITLRS